MERFLRSLVLLAGCVGLLGGSILAAEKSALEPPVPLADMAEEIPHLVKFVEELGKGKIDAALDALDGRLSKTFQIAQGPFEPGSREYIENSYQPFVKFPPRFESVEVIGYSQVSSASRWLVVIANGEFGPIWFHFQMFRYRGQWNIKNMGFEYDWNKIEVSFAHWSFQRFEKPQIFELSPEKEESEVE